ETRRDLADRPADNLHVLVLVEVLLPAALDALGDVQRHALPAEAGRRPERRHLVPLAAAQTRLLLELALRRRERLLALVDRACRHLDELLARRLAQLSHEDDVVVPVDGDDRDRARVFDDLALVVAPALDDDVDELAVVDDAGLVGLAHAASRSTSARCSGPSQGGTPAAAFSAVRSGFDVAGMTTSIRSSESAHFSRACGHVSTPKSRSGSSSSSA